MIFRKFGKLCMNFHSIPVKDTSSSIRLLAKVDLPARASNETRLHSVRSVAYKK